MLTAVGALAAPAVLKAQGSASGVALVIGNSRYKWEASLPNVKRDAPDVAKKFQTLGLKTELMQDVNRDALRSAIDKFAATTRGANLAAFYFAGHGASWEKETYLVSEDADLSDPSAVKTLTPATSVNEAMKGAAHRLQVFDNCRNNPSDGWRQLASERNAVVNLDKQRDGAVDADPNSLTLYSTAPGRVALDGPAGENSPFAAAFLRQLSAASVDLRTLPTKLRRELLIATEGRQVLWDNNTYREPFAIGGAKSAGGGSSVGWAGDPGRIIELPNAYAFTRKYGLPLPEGLIAHRPVAGASHVEKVGSFEFTAQTPAGPMPFLFIVMSVDAGGTAQVIVAVQNNVGHVWGFTTGHADGRRLTFQTNYGRPDRIVDWSDANSGSVASLAESQKGAGKNAVRSVRFTRLDG